MKVQSLLTSLCACFAVANAASQPPAAKHGTLKFETHTNWTRVYFDNPPLNLVDLKVISDFHDFLVWLQPGPDRTEPAPKVVVFSSENNDFYLDHLDLTLLKQPFNPERIGALVAYGEITAFLQNTSTTVFIGEINARANGGGQEMLVQMDMRFAGPNAHSSSVENGLGVIAPSGGQLFLPLLMNKGLALEHLLATKPFTAAEGTRVGLWNRDFESAAALREYVDELAARISLYTTASLAATKSALATTYNPSPRALGTDLNSAFGLIASPEAQALVEAAIQASNDQTLGDFELGLPHTIPQVLFKAALAQSHDEL